MNINNGEKLYQSAERVDMISQLKELRNRVSEIRGDEIEGGFNGIFMALGAEMDRRNRRSNEWHNEITGPIAYDQATNIDNLLQKIERICSEVDSTNPYYFGKLTQLGKVMTFRHGKFGER